MRVSLSAGVEVIIEVIVILLCASLFSWFVWSDRSEIVSIFPSLKSWKSWRAGIVLLVSSLILPPVLVVLATSGDSGDALTRLFGRHPQPTQIFLALPDLCLVGPVVLVAVIPGLMKARGVVPSRAPGWLTGMAAALSGAYIVLLHFGGGALARSSLGVLSVAAFVLAALLVPFYKAVVSACWRSGVTHVFDPVEWWRAWCAAWREIIAPGAAETDPIREPLPPPGGDGAGDQAD